MIVHLITIIWSFKEIWILHFKASENRKKEKYFVFRAEKDPVNSLWSRILSPYIESVRWSY